ncbi:hypothetical protein PoB_003233800 [Plakobranchus ocellatus]|uniref:C3H1-type domain-containing protein n=1 Tax=Plakobranchus ocellatus TaxID=259542 RepID=A0AAV4AH12_9GAST|nr:hypothetical protein PoB_003233800 [Plakobranchus ocellatus]
MATVEPPGSYTAVPTVIDDDVQRTAELILRREVEEGHDGGVVTGLDPEARRKMLEAVCVALQAERNGWKQRLQHTLHEIDREHRASIEIESTLQELVLSLGLAPPPESPTSDRRSSDAIRSLRRYIQQLQARADSAADTTAQQAALAKLRDVVKRLEGEKAELAGELREKMRESAWQSKELNATRSQLNKLRQIVLNYNQSHSTNFHLEEESVDGGGGGTRARSDPLFGGGGYPAPPTTTSGVGMAARERTYVEGDQVNYYSTTGEEIAVWKLRNRRTRGGDGSGGDGSSRSCGGGSGGLGRSHGTGKVVTQCLRCNQFFKGAENTAKSCRYHKKGRQIREQYDASGRLLRVLYTWACCKKGLDAPGCTYGCHI